MFIIIPQVFGNPLHVIIVIRLRVVKQVYSFEKLPVIDFSGYSAPTLPLKPCRPSFGPPLRPIFGFLCLCFGLLEHGTAYCGMPHKLRSVDLLARAVARWSPLVEPGGGLGPQDLRTHPW